MSKTNVRYWLCQLFGWGGWIALNMFFVYLFSSNFFLAEERRKYFFASLIIQFIWYVLSTHLLRVFLKKIGWMRFPTSQVILLFVFSVIVTGLISYYGAKTTAVYSNFSLVQFEKREDLKVAIKREKERGLTGTKYYLAQPQNAKDSSAYAAKQKIKKTTGWYRNSDGVWKYEDQRKGRFWWDIIFNFILIALWLLIYMVWHYLMRNQTDKIARLHLEKTVKDLELRTIKSHINPHFIFNSLNSIRALVDENPERARKAITELSNLLRSSLQMGKNETVLLEQELRIVKDYLALEYIRFEERLKIVWSIEDDSLGEPVPPMMLQTLVENAIKHGISQHVLGGTVTIITTVTDDYLKIIVRNTGNLKGETEGFGLKSTRNRLNLLYGGKAHFSIKQLDDEIVETKVLLPLQDKLEHQNWF